MKHTLLALGMVLSFLAGNRSPADDWPEFRGPTGQGVVENGKLPVKWGRTTNVAWKKPIPGKGWSSPVVVKGRIYLTTSVHVKDSLAGDQSLRALCLDAKTGNVLWDREVFRQDGRAAPRVHWKNSHASPTPLVHDQKLYVHFGHQGTACLDLKGKVLWRNRSLKYNPVHGNGGTAVVVEDALIFNCDGGDSAFVVALNRHTGKQLWKTDRTADAFKKFSFCTPLVITVKGKKQVISPGSEQVSAYDPKDGKAIWTVTYDGYSLVPRPVFGHGLVYVCTGYESPSLLAIRPDGKGDVTKTHVAWTARRGVPLTPSLLLAGDELYMVSDNGVASCLDAKKGKVHWQKRIGGSHSASPILAGGKIYFLSEGGTAVVIQAGKQSKQLGKNELGERTLASYAVAGDALYVRTEKNLYKIQER
jgi:outer membrane protein assembly factor BamB